MTKLAQAPANCVPKIAFMSTSYMHKQFGKTWKPVLKNMGWASTSGGVGEAVAPPDAGVGDPGPDGADEIPFPAWPQAGEVPARLADRLCPRQDVHKYV